MEGKIDDAITLYANFLKLWQEKPNDDIATSVLTITERISKHYEDVNRDAANAEETAKFALRVAKA